MVLGFFEGALTQGAREALPYFSSLVETTLSANSILNELKQSGFTIRRSQGLSIIRHLRGIAATRPYVDSLRLKLLPNPDRLEKPITQTLRQYSYLIKVTGYDTVNESYVSRYYTYSTNSVVSKQNAIDEIQALIESDQSAYPLLFDSGQVVNITNQGSLVP